MVFVTESESVVKIFRVHQDKLILRKFDRFLVLVFLKDIDEILFHSTKIVFDIMLLVLKYHIYAVFEYISSCLSG